MLRRLKNLLKHSYRDTSIRSDFQGLGHLAVTQVAAQFLHVNKIQGSYLEFGVFQGGTFSNFYTEPVNRTAGMSPHVEADQWLVGRITLREYLRKDSIEVAAKTFNSIAPSIKSIYDKLFKFHSAIIATFQLSINS